jgi:hypothetical protein
LNHGGTEARRKIIGTIYSRSNPDTYQKLTQFSVPPCLCGSQLQLQLQLCLELFLLGRGEEHVVEDEAVPGRVRMQ